MSADDVGPRGKSPLCFRFLHLMYFDLFCFITSKEIPVSRCSAKVSAYLYQHSLALKDVLIRSPVHWDMEWTAESTEEVVSSLKKQSMVVLTRIFFPISDVKNLNLGLPWWSNG